MNNSTTTIPKLSIMTILLPPSMFCIPLLLASAMIIYSIMVVKMLVRINGT